MPAPTLLYKDHGCKNFQEILILELTPGYSLEECDKMCSLLHNCTQFEFAEKNHEGCKFFDGPCTPDELHNINVYKKTGSTGLDEARQNAEEIAILKQRLQLKVLREKLEDERSNMLILI